MLERPQNTLEKSAPQAPARISSSRISRARDPDRTDLAAEWLIGAAQLEPSIGLAAQIFQAPASRIRRVAKTAGYSPRRKNPHRKSLAELWQAADAAERAEFLRACGGELWTS